MDWGCSLGGHTSRTLMNALKYAFPNGQPCIERGETECNIDVEFRADGERFTPAVPDNGVDLPPGLDWTKTPSLGMQLISVLIRHRLGGGSKWTLMPERLSRSPSPN
jgi:two-component sensor histidine kinase